MQIAESLKIGAYEIWLHKLRSLLTMLGVIFGVAAVISTAAIGAGAREELRKQLETLGTNTIRVQNLELKGKDASSARRLNPFGLTTGDLQNIRTVLRDELVAASPIKRTEAQISITGRVLPYTVYGTNEDFPLISGYQRAQGRFLQPGDVADAAKVAVIGDAVRRDAFPLTDPLGQSLIIEGQSYKVIGVMAARAAETGGAVIDVGDVDRSVYIPITAALRRLGAGDPRAERLDELAMKAASELKLRESAALVDSILERRHKGVRDFTVLVPEELIRQQQQTKNVLSQVLIFIAAISLLVGGIGIMNIMLATVTQRTREIGIRRALGATRNDILAQFLVESLTLSIIGGLLGIAIGAGLAWGIGNYAGWPIILPLESIIVSTSISALVGLLFGFYPSLKAAQLDPIEALRTE